MLIKAEFIVPSVTWVKTGSCQPLNNQGDMAEKASLLRFHLFSGCYHSILILAFHIISWKLLPLFQPKLQSQKKKKKKIKPIQSILWGNCFGIKIFLIYMHWFIKRLNLEYSDHTLEVLIFFSLSQPALVPLTMGERWGGYDMEMQRQLWVHWLGDSKNECVPCQPCWNAPKFGMTI